MVEFLLWYIIGNFFLYSYSSLQQYPFMIFEAVFMMNFNAGGRLNGCDGVTGKLCSLITALLK